MKSVFVFVITFIAAMNVKAQNDSWKIMHNSQLLLQTSDENEEKNAIIINKRDLHKNGFLEVYYIDRNKPPDWKRIIALFDKVDKQLHKIDGSSLKLSNRQLKTLANESEVIKVYTWALPTDPEEAARIRVRRVHLCTMAVH